VAAALDGPPPRDRRLRGPARARVAPKGALIVLEFLAVLVILALVAWFVSGPLRQQRAEAEAEANPELETLEAAKEAKYREIREAELDYRTGKLSEADYRRIDATLRAEAMDLLKQEDELKP
jgi:hypothetical protein